MRHSGDKLGLSEDQWEGKDHAGRSEGESILVACFCILPDLLCSAMLSLHRSLFATPLLPWRCTALHRSAAAGLPRGPPRPAPPAAAPAPTGLPLAASHTGVRAAVPPMPGSAATPITLRLFIRRSLCHESAALLSVDSATLPHIFCLSSCPSSRSAPHSISSNVSSSEHLLSCNQRFGLLSCCCCHRCICCFALPFPSSPLCPTPCSTALPCSPLPLVPLP